MDYYEETMKNLREYFSDKAECYEKGEGSSYDGLVINDKESDILFDLRMTKNNMLIFEAYPTIQVLKEYIESLVLYCTRIKTRFGNVYVKEQSKSVLFHAETSYRDNPITENTLKELEKEAKRILKKHHDNLVALAKGHVLDVRPVIETDKEYDDLALEDIKENIDVCSEYLKGSNHNAICANVHENDDNIFCSQMLTGEEAYRFKYIFDKKSGMFSMKAEYGENSCIFQDEYKYAVAMIANHCNSKYACGCLKMNESNSIYAVVTSSIQDGVLSKELYEYMENCLVCILHDAMDKIEKVTSGRMIDPDLFFDNSKESKEDILAAIKELEAKRRPGIPSFEEFLRAKGKKLPSGALGELPLVDKIQAELDALDEEEYEDEECDDISMEDFLDDLSDIG